MLARGAWPASSEATAGLALRSGTLAGRCPAAAPCRVSTPGPRSSVTGVTRRARRSPVAPAGGRGHVGDDREGEQLSDRDVLPPGYLQVGRDRPADVVHALDDKPLGEVVGTQPRRSRSSRTRPYGCAPADASRRWRTRDGRYVANRLSSAPRADKGEVRDSVVQPDHGRV